MPFAELPGSHIAGLQTPDWTRFASQAVDLIAHQPVPDYSSIVKDATDQIDEIVKMASPEGRMERALKREQLSAMVQTYRDYREHPDRYTLTAHGPVQKSVTDELLKGARFKQAMTAAALSEAKLKNEQAAGSTNDFISTLRARAAGFFGRSDIPTKGPTDLPQVVPGQTSPPPVQDTNEVPVRTDDENSETSADDETAGG